MMTSRLVALFLVLCLPQGSMADDMDDSAEAMPLFDLIKGDNLEMYVTAAKEGLVYLVCPATTMDKEGFWEKTKTAFESVSGKWKKVVFGYLDHRIEKGYAETHADEARCTIVFQTGDPQDEKTPIFRAIYGDDEEMTEESVEKFLKDAMDGKIEQYIPPPPPPPPQQAEASHILIKDEEGVDNEAKIKELKAQLDASSNVRADFAKLAEEHSGCPSGKSTGGSLGRKNFDPGAMVSEFDEVVFKTGTVGKVSDPVKTSVGWHILLITSRNEETMAEL